VRDDADPMRRVIQAILDETGEGWTVSDFCVPMGLERINSAGQFEQVPWMYTPTYQADYITDGLILKAGEWQCTHVDEDTD
jgi:hypothetical protein